MEIPASESPTENAGELCGICLSPIGADEPKSDCPSCNAHYHAECWEENKGCAVYGCSKVAAAEQRSALEIPVSYWGQEHKECPQCRMKIMAAAVRCRFCGAVFESARPQDKDEFEHRSDLAKRLPAAKTKTIWIFIFCVIPCLAPIGLIWGLIWHASHRDEVRALPSLYYALSKIGLGVAITQVVGIVILTMLYSVVRGG